MKEHIVAINPTIDGSGTHDPSAVIFEDGQPVFGVEEERFTREKHAENTFPKQAIQACLDFCDCDLSEVRKVVITWKLKEKAKNDLLYAFQYPSLAKKGYNAVQALLAYGAAQTKLKSRLNGFGSPMPPIELRKHHLCHAASAFYPSGFNNSLVITIDGRGESESTVIWEGSPNGLTEIRSYPTPNSWGMFYSLITEFLGYRSNNGEGKVMGLAPYGSRNEDIENKLRQLIDTGVEYDVTPLFEKGFSYSIGKLEQLFGRDRKSDSGEFTEWQKDLAHVAQKLLEETVVAIVEAYCQEYDHDKVCLAGGVALNCKMNKRVMELDVVDEVFVQPVAHDAGTAIGAGFLEYDVADITEMSDVYWGPQYTLAEIKAMLDRNKIDYFEPDELERYTAKQLADGQLVGWFQGRLEMGPRALGNRSILADSRSRASRDRVNKFVKHREEWRPFAPSLLEEAADEYLIDSESAPYMVQTFDVKNDKKDEIPAVLHSADDTTRPQTVRENQNPRFYRLIHEFEKITGVPVVLNTSFNDHGEPIVNTPIEAIKDFFGMGLDALVLEDVVVEK